METFELKRLENELSLINEILNKICFSDVYRIQQLLYNMRLEREIKRNNLIQKLKGVEY